MAEIVEIGENVNNLQPDAQNYSRLCTNSFVYSWTIADFSSCLEFPNATIFSPEFNFEKSNWRLMLGISSKAKELNKIKVYLCKTERGGSGYHVEHKISLFDEEGFFAAKKSKSQYDGDNKFGSKITFSCNDEKDIRNLILSDDKLMVYCELSVLTAVTSKDPLQARINSNTTNNTIGKIKKLKTSGKGDGVTKITKPKPIFVRRRDRKYQFESAFLLCFIALVIHVTCTSLPNLKQTREINDLIIDTTLKVITIADALNLTELKTKSLNLLSSLPEEHNISDLKVLKFPDALSSKFKKENASEYVPPV